jgi:chromosome segregation ATPase
MDRTLEIRCEKLQEQVTLLTAENKGLSEYSNSRDESIKVYREEIKELKEELLQWRKAWEMYEKEYFELTKEKVKLKERLEGFGSIGSNG